MQRSIATVNLWRKGPAFALWKAAFLGEPGYGPDDPAAKEPRRDTAGYPAEFGALLALVEGVRRRLLINRLIGSWMVCLSWIFLGLIFAAALSRNLKYSLAAAVVMAALGLVVLFVREWVRRPSGYFCAREMDRASGLSDRLSTALYFASSGESDPMIRHQRSDALGKVGRIDPRELFPMRIPQFASRTMALALIAFALLGYRLYYSPPIMALLHRAATSQLARAVVSPLTGAMKKDLLALVKRDDSEIKQASPDAETVSGLAESKNADDASQLGDKDGAAPGDQDDADSATEGAEGDPNAPEAGANPQGQGQDASQGGNSDNQQMADANQPSSSENGQNGSSQQQQQAGQGQSSSSGSMMQALKNLMKNMTGQPSQSDSNGQPTSAGSSQQPGSSSGQGEAKNDSPKDGSEQKEAGSSSSSQKPGGGAGNGSTPVPKVAAKETPPPPKNLPQDRVNLEANDFRQQGHVRTTSAAGTAQLPLRDIKPAPVAAIKGSEQENIPVRYRLYVQRYFEHSDKAPEQIQPPR
jgi:hypothetical protein